MKYQNWKTTIGLYAGAFGGIFVFIYIILMWIVQDVKNWMKR